MVQILLEAGAELNAKLLNGMTPLHIAAQGYDPNEKDHLEGVSNPKKRLRPSHQPSTDVEDKRHQEVVEYLLRQRAIKLSVRDTFGFTPFLRAVQNKHKNIISLLAPFNQDKSLSEDALGACNGFNATIVCHTSYSV